MTEDFFRSRLDAPSRPARPTTLLGETLQIAGRPRLATRLMVALTLLKNSFDMSDEELVARFAGNVYWQYFAGYAYFDPRPTCDATPPRSGAFVVCWERPDLKSCSKPPSTPPCRWVP